MECTWGLSPRRSADPQVSPVSSGPILGLGGLAPQDFEMLEARSSSALRSGAPRSGVEAFPGLQRAPSSFVEAASSLGDEFLHRPLAVLSHGIPGTRKRKPQQVRQLRGPRL